MNYCLSVDVSIVLLSETITIILFEIKALHEKLLPKNVDFPDVDFNFMLTYSYT